MLIILLFSRNCNPCPCSGRRGSSWRCRSKILGHYFSMITNILLFLCSFLIWSTIGTGFCGQLAPSTHKSKYQTLSLAYLTRLLVVPLISTTLLQQAWAWLAQEASPISSTYSQSQFSQAHRSQDSGLLPNSSQSNTYPHKSNSHQSAHSSTLSHLFSHTSSPNEHIPATALSPGW